MGRREAGGRAGGDWWGLVGGASGPECLPEGAAWGAGSVDTRQVGRVELCLDSQELNLRTTGDLERRKLPTSVVRWYIGPCPWTMLLSHELPTYCSPFYV